jgi:undecaprenyl diphosphate synthase
MLIEISKELFVPSKYAKPPAHVSGTKPPKIAKHKLPKHIAVVMDGNGRWAKAQGLPRTAGHEAGEAALLDVVHGALELGIPWVSAYAFSTENWKRTPEEVKFLMGFNRDVIRRRRDELHEMGVQVRWVGRRGKLWPSVISELEHAAELTRKNTAMTLTMCVNYGGQAEIVDAVKRIATDVTAGKINPERITEKTIAKYLYDPEMPDVDLFIRSSGEHRTSNFLLWQSSYAELIFDDSMWPDFNRLHLFKAVEEFASRSRRFGSA